MTSNPMRSELLRSAALLSGLVACAGDAAPEPEAPAEPPPASSEVTEEDVSKKQSRRPFLKSGLEVFQVDPSPMRPLLRPLPEDLEGPDYGAVAEWASVIHHVQRTAPDDPHAALLEAHAWLILDNPGEALRLARAAPEHAETAVWRALVTSAALVELDELDAAAEALAAAPAAPEVRYEQGRVLAKQSDHGGAKAAAAEACEAGLRDACLTRLAYDIRKDRRQTRRAARGKSKRGGAGALQARPSGDGGE